MPLACLGGTWVSAILSSRFKHRTEAVSSLTRRPHTTYRRPLLHARTPSAHLQATRSSPLNDLSPTRVACASDKAVVCSMRLEARLVAAPSLDAVKMEDRKRPIADDAAPPAKRQALAVNGARSHPDADAPWKEDIEVRPPSLSPFTPPSRDRTLLTLRVRVELPKGRHPAANARIQAGEGHR